MLRNNRATLIFAASIGALALSLGCTADTSGLATLSIDEAVSRLERGDGLLFVDANSDDTRAKYGTIEGAVLLSSYRDYALAELPEDGNHPIVFYCHSPRCGAAADAARRALAAGYEAVFVMPAGITGWRDANRSVVAVVSQ